ncbi:Chitin binding domain [Trinorchestia longiramus]|nr:Chitin binding domain [Trinorchestia longiramus]
MNNTSRIFVVTDVELAILDPAGGLSALSIENFTTRSLVSNITFRQLNVDFFKVSADSEWVLLAEHHKGIPSRKMPRLVFVLLAVLAGSGYARMAYQLPAGMEDLFRGRSLIQTFSCEGRRYGYYADTDNNCQIFHVCLPIEDDVGQAVETAHFSFVCGNETIFDQSTLTCESSSYALPCDEAENFYDVVNSEFGKVLDEYEK